MSTAPAIAYDDQVSLQEEAKREAERLLVGFWGGYRYPVDPVRIARLLGISVVDAHLGSDIAGAIVKEGGRDPVILLNESDHPNRKRFTAAHEIGHFVRHKEDAFEYVDRRDTLSTTGTDADEIFANAFAANLLMPEQDVRRLFREDLSDLEMAARFGVSREAVGFRVSNLALKRD